VPELPEVEITRRGIEPFVIGKTITGVAVRNRDLRQRIPRNLASILVGQRVKRLVRRGKYLLFECDAGSLIVHLGMSGSLRVIEPGTLPREHDHVDLVFGGTALRLRDPRRFGVVLWKDGDAFRHPLLARLGVEPLGEHFSPEFLYRASRGRGVGIKQLLMNANVVVGIGNIYANESLFKAAVRDVLAAAIAAGGSSLRDFVQSDGSPGYFQQHYCVYDRAALPCRVCGAAIRVSRMGQRSSFYCATCQK